MLEWQTNRPRWQPTDRLLLAAISRVLPRPSWRSSLPSPKTLLRWHREWSCVAGPRIGGEPVAAGQLQGASRTSSSFASPERPRVGAFVCIQGELLKLGHRCSHQTVQRVLHPGAAPQPALLARVRSPARRQDPGTRGGPTKLRGPEPQLLRDAHGSGHADQLTPALCERQSVGERNQPPLAALR